jgi:hypothetical protein
MMLRRRPDLLVYLVGATGFEPVTLPCQIQRAATALYNGRSRSVKDQWKAAGDPKCQRLAAWTIYHGSPRIVLIPTAVDCCPSAARRTEPDLRDHNLIRPLVSSQLRELKGRRPAIPPNRQ